MAAQDHLRNLLTTAGITTAVSTAVVLLASKQQTGSAAAGLNAVSHMVWGEAAANTNRFDCAHTLLGGVLNAGAMLAWSGVQELVFPRPRSLLGAAAVGAAVSGLAYVTDYYVVPKRLTPGFEKRLSSGAMLAIYGSLAVALGAGALASRRAREKA